MWYGVQACAEPGGLGDGYRGASDGWVLSSLELAAVCI